MKIFFTIGLFFSLYALIGCTGFGIGSSSVTETPFSAAASYRLAAARNNGSEAIGIGFSPVMSQESSNGPNGEAEGIVNVEGVLLLQGTDGKFSLEITGQLDLSTGDLVISTEGEFEDFTISLTVKGDLSARNSQPTLFLKKTNDSGEIIEVMVVGLEFTDTPLNTDGADEGDIIEVNHGFEGVYHTAHPDPNNSETVTVTMTSTSFAVRPPTFSQEGAVLEVIELEEDQKWILLTYTDQHDVLGLYLPGGAGGKQAFSIFSYIVEHQPDGTTRFVDYFDIRKDIILTKTGFPTSFAFPNISVASLPEENAYSIYELVGGERHISGTIEERNLMTEIVFSLGTGSLITADGDGSTYESRYLSDELIKRMADYADNPSPYHDSVRILRPVAQ